MTAAQREARYVVASYEWGCLTYKGLDKASQGHKRAMELLHLIVCGWAVATDRGTELLDKFTQFVQSIKEDATLYTPKTSSQPLLCE